MDIFLHFFYKIVAKTYSKMHQIAPFLKRIIGRTYPRTLLALKYLHFSKINLNPPPPPPPKSKNPRYATANTDLAQKVSAFVYRQYSVGSTPLHMDNIV